MSKDTVAALIPAAGSGTRLGMGFKALVELGGMTLLERAIVNLAPHADELIVAIAPPMREATEALLERLHTHTPLRWPLRWIEGGDTRQASVRRLLEASRADLVLIHDAARPFVSAGVVRALRHAVQEHGAATVALPSVDTLIRSSGAVWDGLLDRSHIQAVQTPQGGRRDWLLGAHAEALSNGWEATDDGGLLARAGHTVHLVQGDSRLFKITTPGDLELARAFVGVWDRQQT